jgi:hypothetical protein
VKPPPCQVCGAGTDAFERVSVRVFIVRNGMGLEFEAHYCPGCAPPSFEVIRLPKATAGRIAGNSSPARGADPKQQ